LYLDKGKPVFHYNFVDVAHYEVAGKDSLAPGRHTIKMDFTYDGGGIGKGGSGGGQRRWQGGREGACRANDPDPRRPR